MDLVPVTLVPTTEKDVHLLCQKAFRRLHPDWGIALAQAWSRRSRSHTDQPFNTSAEEHLYQHCVDWLSEPKNDSVDAFVFGHRHLPLDLPIEGHTARYLNTGDWIEHRTSVLIHRRPSSSAIGEQKGPSRGPFQGVHLVLPKPQWRTTNSRPSIVHLGPCAPRSNLTEAPARQCGRVPHR